MIYLKIFIIVLIAYLWRLGGTNKKAWCRDVLVPIILGGYIGINYSYLVGFFTIASFQIIRIGYGAYDPEHDDKPSLLAKLTHDREGWINRWIAGFLYGLAGGTPIFIYWYTQNLITNGFLIATLAYLLINMLIGGVLSKIRTVDFIIEPAIGAGVATLIFLF